MLAESALEELNIDEDGISELEELSADDEDDGAVDDDKIEEDETAIDKMLGESLVEDVTLELDELESMLWLGGYLGYLPHLGSSLWAQKNGQGMATMPTLTNDYTSY